MTMTTPDTQVEAGWYVRSTTLYPHLPQPEYTATYKGQKTTYPNPTVSHVRGGRSLNAGRNRYNDVVQTYKEWGPSGTRAEIALVFLNEKGDVEETENSITLSRP